MTRFTNIVNCIYSNQLKVACLKENVQNKDHQLLNNLEGQTRSTFNVLLCHHARTFRCRVNRSTSVSSLFALLDTKFSLISR